MAEEMMSFTRNQILMQAGVAMLAKQRYPADCSAAIRLRESYKGGEISLPYTKK